VLPLLISSLFFDGLLVGSMKRDQHVWANGGNAAKQAFKLGFRWGDGGMFADVDLQIRIAKHVQVLGFQLQLKTLPHTRGTSRQFHPMGPSIDAMRCGLNAALRPIASNASGLGCSSRLPGSEGFSIYVPLFLFGFLILVFLFGRGGTLVQTDFSTTSI